MRPSRALITVLVIGGGATAAALQLERRPDVRPMAVQAERIEPESPPHLREHNSGGLGNTLPSGGGGGHLYGNGTGQASPVVSSGENSVVIGSLDKELIRQVVHRNRQQIRYCYEAALVKSPELVGTVDIAFVIGPDGAVQTAKVASSSVHEPELEQCLAARFKGWLFPKPKGGGIVSVTYPVVLKGSGEATSHQ